MVPFLVMALVSSVLLIRIRRRRDKKRNGDQQFVGVRARWPLAPGPCFSPRSHMSISTIKLPWQRVQYVWMYGRNDIIDSYFTLGSIETIAVEMKACFFYLDYAIKYIPCSHVISAVQC